MSMVQDLEQKQATKQTNNKNKTERKGGREGT